jgi:hypothetical protein
VRETLREHGEPMGAGAMTFMQARTANEVLKAQERRVRLQRLKGELVDRAKAVAQVFRLARDERDAWINWPARVAAVMAAELGVGVGETRIHAETATFELRASEVAKPRPGDQLIVDGQSFVVQGEPERRDPDRLLWSLDARPA